MSLLLETWYFHLKALKVMSIITSLVGQLYFFRFDHPLYYHLSNEAKGQCLSCIDIT